MYGATIKIKIRLFLFIVSPSLVTLSYRKLASAGKFLENCSAQGNGKRGTIYSPIDWSNKKPGRPE
jgi:hypothetical protein